MARARRRRRAPAGLTDLLVLDADAVSKAAANDRTVQAWLERARELDADVVVSAVTVTELVRGVARDASINRVLKAADVQPVDESLARRAGRLLGRSASDATVDALVAATAVNAHGPKASDRGCVLLTSDPHDVKSLLVGLSGDARSRSPHHHADERSMVARCSYARLMPTNAYGWGSASKVIARRAVSCHGRSRVNRVRANSARVSVIAEPRASGRPDRQIASGTGRLASSSVLRCVRSSPSEVFW